MDIKFAIVIPTYRNGNGRTPFYLERALKSVFDQTYQNFHIFVIGDKYEPSNEFDYILEQFDMSKIYSVNLPVAEERSKYIDNLEALWHYGGVFASNLGINTALTSGYDYVCRLDHDDYYTQTHLENFAKVIKETNADWLCSKSTYLGTQVLPAYPTDEFYVKFRPQPCQLINSSTCINFRKIPIRYRDMFAETGMVLLPSDAQMWLDMRNYIDKNNLISVMINRVTCGHDEEGTVKIRNI